MSTADTPNGGTGAPPFAAGFDPSRIEGPLAPFPLAPLPGQTHGRLANVRRADLATIRLLRKMHQTIADGDESDRYYVEAVRRIVPDITDEELDALTPTWITALTLYSRGEVDYLLEVLEKNGYGGPNPEASLPPRSTPMTETSTPSPELPAGSAG